MKRERVILIITLFFGLLAIVAYPFIVNDEVKLSTIDPIIPETYEMYDPETRKGFEGPPELPWGTFTSCEVE